MKKNLLLRFLVLLIALFFWLQQALLREQQEIMKIPVVFVNIPSDMLIMEPENPHLPILLKGRGVHFLFIKMRNAHIEIDASDFEYGRNEYPLSEDNFKNLEKLNIIYDNRDFDGLNYVLVDRIVERRINVDIVYANSEEENYFYKYKDIGSDLSVLVKGPLSKLDQLESIKTEPISQQMIENGTLSLVLTNNDSQLLLSKNTLMLNLLHERLVNKTLSLITINYPVDYDITIIPQKVSIMVRGPQNIIDKLDKTDIEAYLDDNELNKIKSGREVQLGVKFNLPSGIKLLEYTPSRIQVIRNG